MDVLFKLASLHVPFQCDYTMIPVLPARIFVFIIAVLSLVVPSSSFIHTTGSSTRLTKSSLSTSLSSSKLKMTMTPPTTTTTANAFLNTLRKQVPKFLPAVTSKLLDKPYQIDCSNLIADHVCWRTETMEEYTNLVDSLKEEKKKNNAAAAAAAANAQLLIESEIGGRPIATFRLLEPIECVYTITKKNNNNNNINFHHSIDVIEIPSPKSGSPYPSGLEHVEFVIPTTILPRNTTSEDTTTTTNDNTSTTTTTTTTTTCPLNDEIHQASLEAFMAKHPSDWNTKAKTKANNPDISLKLKGLDDDDSSLFGGEDYTCTVKFHLMPLDKVIAWEVAAQEQERQQQQQQ